MSHDGDGGPGMLSRGLLTNMFLKYLQSVHVAAQMAALWRSTLRASIMIEEDGQRERKRVA